MSSRPEPNGTGGVRISNREIYDLLTQVRDIVLEERERRRSLTLQVKALWTVNLLVVGGLATAGIKVFT
jgi:hypothetical protein